MTVNRGKQFEEQIKAGFERVPQTSIMRLIDPQNGYAGVRNICDFVVYHYPHMYYVECKSVHGRRFPFANLTDNQYNGLSAAARINGLCAGVMLWYVDYDKTFWVPIQFIEERVAQEDKSIPYDDPALQEFEVKAHKRRLLFDYDFSEFF